MKLTEGKLREMVEGIIKEGNWWVVRELPKELKSRVVNVSAFGVHFDIKVFARGGKGDEPFSADVHSASGFQNLTFENNDVKFWFENAMEDRVGAREGYDRVLVRRLLKMGASDDYNKYLEDLKSI